MISTKHPLLDEAIGMLFSRLGPGVIKVTDYWDGDLLATGVSNAVGGSNLVYIALATEPERGQLQVIPGRFNVILQQSRLSDSEALFEDCGEFERVDFERLLSVVRSHLVD